MSDYYQRTTQTFLDGTPIFKVAEDEKAENQVAEVLTTAWRCELRSFGCLAPLDWFAQRDGRMVGVLELKHRSHPFAKYPTVFLNARKWLSLVLASVGFRVPAIFVAQFTDQIRWINVAEIDASKIRLGGCKQIVKSRNDIEPVIEVPVGQMAQLRDKQA